MCNPGCHRISHMTLPHPQVLQRLCLYIKVDPANDAITSKRSICRKLQEKTRLTHVTLILLVSVLGVPMYVHSWWQSRCINDAVTLNEASLAKTVIINVYLLY